MNPKANVVTRFAPSPTGFMHIGGARTALFAYLLARKNNGTFILRIEDTDKAREVPGSIAHIQETLRWLGIEWDYGPDKENPFGSALQSERLETYRAAAEQLIEKGYAYPDPYSEEELAAFRAQADAEKRPFLFRDHRPEVFEKWDGKKSLRFKVPEIKRYKWNDAVRGDLEAGEEALDDFILIKGDGYPTYNFAHIIDDHAMGVTHILRADEFISSTPRFLSLYDALGIVPPIFATLPPILKDDRTKKLGKRDGAKDVLDYKKEGYLPETLVNFLALIGWNPGTEQELFSMDELVQAFDLSGVQKSGGAFNVEKLNWMNKEYIKKIPTEEFQKLIREWGGAAASSIPEEKLTVLLPIIRDRITTLGEIATLFETGEFSYLFEKPSYDVAVLKTPEFLPAVIPMIEALDESNFTAETVKAALWDHATEKGRGNVLWPMRVALTGKEKSPDPFTVAALLGKTETLSRLQHATTLIK